MTYFRKVAPKGYWRTTPGDWEFSRKANQWVTAEELFLFLRAISWKQTLLISMHQTPQLLDYDQLREKLLHMQVNGLPLIMSGDWNFVEDSSRDRLNCSNDDNQATTKIREICAEFDLDDVWLETNQPDHGYTLGTEVNKEHDRIVFENLAEQSKLMQRFLEQMGLDTSSPKLLQVESAGY